MTVLARVVRATPHRSAYEAWEVIAGLLAPDGGAVRDELAGIAGIATLLIAAEAPKECPIVVWGAGPRVRIKCIYNEEALISDSANETKLAESPTIGDWSMSFPCPEEDLSWVQTALGKRSKRVTARKIGDKVASDADEGKSATTATIDTGAFLRP